jgi:hypothetical protein
VEIVIRGDVHSSRKRVSASPANKMPLTRRKARRLRQFWFCRGCGDACIPASTYSEGTALSLEIVFVIVVGLLILTAIAFVISYMK